MCYVIHWMAAIVRATIQNYNSFFYIDGEGGLLGQSVSIAKPLNEPKMVMKVICIDKLAPYVCKAQTII